MKEYLNRIVFRTCNNEFNLDDLNYVKSHLDDLDNLSKSEIRNFLNEMLCMDDIENSLKFLCKSGFLFKVFPEFNELEGLKQPPKYHDHDVLGHVLLATCYSENDLVLRLTMLLHDIGKKDTFTVSEEGKITFYGHGIKGSKVAYNMLTRLGYDKKLVNEVCMYIMHHMDYAPTEKSFNKMLKEFGNDLGKVEKFLGVKLCDKYACKGKESEIARKAEEEIADFKKFLDKYKR